MQTIMMDVDGVLVTGRPKDGAHLFTDIEADLGMTLATLQREFFTTRWQAIVTGKKPLLPELAEVLALVAPNVSAERLIDYWFENDSRIDRAVLADMGKLRAAGHRVYLATNQEHMRATYLMETLGLITLVDDTEQNVLAAREKGWTAVHWRPGMLLLPGLAAGSGQQSDI